MTSWQKCAIFKPRPISIAGHSMNTHFSRLEVRDILISVAVLCVVFSYPEFLSSPGFFLFSFLAVGIAFIGHELSHKFMAIRAGFWAEYRMWPQGILLAGILALATGGRIIFAAPGAVYFREHWLRGGQRRKHLLRISIAGVVFNVTLMWAFFAGFLATGYAPLSYMAMINGWLAIFNLIPFGGLDGQKTFELDKKVWAVLLALAASGFVLLNFF
jgi:Zn-dependent protease